MVINAIFVLVLVALRPFLAPVETAFNVLYYLATTLLFLCEYIQRATDDDISSSPYQVATEARTYASFTCLGTLLLYTLVWGVLDYVQGKLRERKIKKASEKEAAEPSVQDTMQKGPIAAPAESLPDIIMCMLMPHTLYNVLQRRKSGVVKEVFSLAELWYMLEVGHDV